MFPFSGFISEVKYRLVFSCDNQTVDYMHQRLEYSPVLHLTSTGRDLSIFDRKNQSGK